MNSTTGDGSQRAGAGVDSGAGSLEIMMPGVAAADAALASSYRRRARLRHETRLR